MKIRAAALLAGLAGLAQAQNTPPVAVPVDRVTLQAEHSELDKGNTDWRELTLQLSRQWQPREAAELGLAQTRRFGLDDTQLRLGYSRPLSQRLTGSLQASASPTHRVLPKGSLGGALQYEFSPGWLLHGGARHTRYDATDVDEGRLALERYFGDYSLLAGWTPARALGQDTHAFELRGSWYYAPDSSVGVIAARGDEATQLGEDRIVLAEVRSLALLGRHRLSPQAALLWSLGRTRQGSFYTRTGASLGLQFAF
ncbi:YaiO family outer membrane beta-barrel protein [Ramlibacter tataouinensis]|uniref:YaiO beta-barrel domain-containing protein n=1 Tax=Ramlibacter tataouinensis (strain ATCC BAA-407 / DSM 14655 / LMG 21543 / TTB310) TaxID=365046 RepID=F5Y0M5_RAMTT|nr:YaiO family outer membrane beta-barrel protein [Ramlibacter tataouinensis]AEG93431.1 Conserved hypothetical protein [Ramlibacter tataouinensis TTB310]